MVYKSFNGMITLRLALFFAASAGITYAFMNRHWLLFIPLAIFLLIVFFNLLYLLNSTNRKTAYFFDAIVNEDTTLHFPENMSPGSMNDLHASFNRLNNHIADIKLKNEHNEKFFQELLKTSATGLIAVNEKGYIEHINDAALEFINLQQISHMDLLRQKNNELYNLMETLKPGQSQTIKVLHKNEFRLFSFRTALLRFGDEQFKLYSISDIKAELEENELDSWQKLIRVMTHEIMNSIAPITSMSNTMSRILTKDNKPLPIDEINEKHISSIIEGLSVIENTGKGLMRFVDDYRRLTKIPDPVFRPVSIESWLSSIRLLTAERLTAENIELVIINKSKVESFIGDEKLLNRVMINLINNAADALGETEFKKIQIEVSENADGRLKITVSDNGKGINPDDIEKIFIPFYTTKENGSGIGLSLSRKIMRLHKGSLSASSVQGEKTVFTLNF